ncbi:MAG: hypothetical protein IT456_03510 [Planctomycetes bacterium]|nr:hypothetical protein [Planctomycetota bacterium]
MPKVDRGPIAYQGLFLLTSDGRRRPADVTGPGSGSFSTMVPPGSYELRTRVGGVDGKEVSLASFVVAAGQEVDLGVVVMPPQDAKLPR